SRVSCSTSRVEMSLCNRRKLIHDARPPAASPLAPKNRHSRLPRAISLHLSRPLRPYL
ncbi:hypothetical protein COCVIDRAFT_106890, partial [Bipolaris victoriae FI3]